MPNLGQSQAGELPLVFEQMRNFGGGEDSFDDPIDLGPTTSQRLVNIYVKDKRKARTRPGADALSGAAIDASLSQVQGLYWFSNPTYPQLLIAASGGNLYRWNGVAWTALPGFTLTTGAVPFEAAMGVDKLLITDGIKNLQTFDGAAFVDCGNDAITSPPVGATILLYHTGRMFAAGVAAFPDTIWVSNRLAFGAAQWNTTSRSFRVGSGDADPIVGLAKSLGYMAVVLKQNSIWYMITDPRQEPVNFAASQDVQSISDGIGCVGKKAWLMYGNDILFMSQDGVRSVQRMQSATGQFQLSAPMSVPVQYWIDQINWSAASTIVATKYRELALFAIPTGINTHPDTTLVWNGRLGVWMGAWQGWTPTCWAQARFNGVPTLCFGDGAGKVNQWKDLLSATADSTYKDNGAAYGTKLWTRSFTAGDIEAPKQGFDAKVRFNSGHATGLVFTAVGDDVLLNSFAEALVPSGDILGSHQVGGFRLATQKPSVVPLSLRGLPSFNELYLKIESAGGWFECRNLTVGARVRPLKVK